MADYQQHAGELRQAGIALVVASVDSEADARKMLESESLGYPVGYGLEAEDVARTLGSFYADDDELPYLHPADFIIRPDGTIDGATYSTSAPGRLTAADAIRMIGVRKQMLEKV